MNRFFLNRAFSLLELLVVMAVIAILFALVLPQATRIGSGISVASAGNELKSQILLARQTAISLNRPVEFRCYEIAPKQGVGIAFCAFQIWIYDENGFSAHPLGKIVYLPQGVIFDAKAVNGNQAATVCTSTLIDSAPNVGTQKIDNTSMQGSPYRAFRFNGKGNTNLDHNGPGGTGTNTWYFSVRGLQDKGTNGNPPKNFFTIQIDPLMGQTRYFRP